MLVCSQRDSHLSSNSHKCAYWGLIADGERDDADDDYYVDVADDDRYAVMFVCIDVDGLS